MLSFGSSVVGHRSSVFGTLPGPTTDD